MYKVNKVNNVPFSSFFIVYEHPQTGHRDLSMDFMYCIVVLGVLLFHSRLAYGALGDLIRTFTTRYSVPMAFILSGYMFCLRGLRQDYVTFVKKRAKRLLIPYVTLNSLGLVAGFFIRRFSNFPQRYEITWGSIYNIIFDHHQTPLSILWFLPCLFFTSSIIFPFRSLLIRRSAAGITGVAALLAFVHVAHVPEDILGMNFNFEYLIFYFIGCIACLGRDRLQVRRPIASALLFFAVLLVIHCALDQPGISLLGAPVRTAAFFCLSQRYRNRPMRLLSPLYGKTYQIYLLSAFPLGLVQAASRHFHVLLLDTPPVYFFFSIFFALAVHYAIDHYVPVLSILVGMRSPSRRAVAERQC